MSKEFTPDEIAALELLAAVNVAELERKRILANLKSYFELTRFSEEVEGAEPNPEWDAGFQAAMTFVKAPDNETLTECECDPCDDTECSCRGKRCNFCKEKEN